MSGESILEYYSNITAKPVDFLWYPFLPCGKLALLQSDPGIGKTQLALYIASLLTRGLPMPDSDIAIEPANVIFQTAEDSPEDTIKPRLEALQADCSRIAFIKKSVTLQSDELEHAIQQSGARMVCFNPVQAFWGNGIDMNRANSVRPLLSELGKIAFRTHCAILLIRHQSKGRGKVIYRGLGSIDLPAACRSVMALDRLKDNPNVRILKHIKSSLAPEGSTVAFEIGDNATVNWFGKYDVDDDSLLGGKAEIAETKTDTAAEIMLEMLETEPCLCADIYAACLERGIKEHTVDNAKRNLGVKSVKIGNVWYWSLDEENCAENE